MKPEALTDDQILALKTVDERLGRRAATKREQAQRTAAAARHRQTLGLPMPARTKHDELDEVADAVIDQIVLALVEPRQQIKILQGLCQTLEQRNRELEGRLLDLEAQAAAARPPVDHVER